MDFLNPISENTSVPSSFLQQYLARDPDLIPVSAVNGSPVGDLIVAVLARLESG